MVRGWSIKSPTYNPVKIPPSRNALTQQHSRFKGSQREDRTPGTSPARQTRRWRVAGPHPNRITCSQSPRAQRVRTCADCPQSQPALALKAYPSCSLNTPQPCSLSFGPDMGPSAPGSGTSRCCQTQGTDTWACSQSPATTSVILPRLRSLVSLQTQSTAAPQWTVTPHHTFTLKHFSKGKPSSALRRLKNYISPM